MSNPERLSESVRSAILLGQNVVSAVSYWEVALKFMKGNLDVGDPATWWSNCLVQLLANPLNLKAEHVAALTTLPPIHQDPFDRMLVAQAKAAGLTILTMDNTMARYATNSVQVIS
jgi:PIN domain nuclease of toxin-antitoxin system